MADVIGLSDVSSKDTGKGSKLKTGNLKRSYKMASKSKCSTKQVWNAKLKKCVSKNPAQLKAIERKKEQKAKARVSAHGRKDSARFKKKIGKMRRARTLIQPGGGEGKVWINE